MLAELEGHTSQIISSEPNAHKKENIPLYPKIREIMQPLREAHLEFMASLKGATEKALTEHFCSAREKGLFVTMKDLIDLHDSISLRASMDVEYDEKNKRLNTALRHLKRKMEPQGLIIHSELLKDPKDNKYKNFLVLLTKEEKEALDSFTHTSEIQSPEDTNGKKQFLDVKQISKITGFDPVRLSQIIGSLVKNDPSIEIYRNDPKKPTKMYFSAQDVLKKIVPTLNAIQEKRKTPNSTAQKPLGPEKIKEAAGQEKEYPSDDNPFHREYLARGLLGKTLEEAHRDLEIKISNLLLSHLAHDTLSAVIKDPKKLLQNFLPRTRYARISLLSVIQDASPKEFILTGLTNCLQRVWRRNGAAWSDPENDKKSINYCLQIKSQGLTPDDILEKVGVHFSTRTAVTSPAAR